MLDQAIEKEDNFPPINRCPHTHTHKGEGKLLKKTIKEKP
jgi:hypothetical protein